VTDATLLVLASLADGEKHGYAMMEDIQRFARVRLGPGTLYGAITRMEQRRWIEPVNFDLPKLEFRKPQDRRQPYRMTPDGRDYLKNQIAGMDKVLETALRRLESCMGKARS
jgi:DNA-binding PadR family transcriptional regulator